MNCGVFTSISLILLAALALVGIASQESMIADPLFGAEAPNAVTVQIVPAPPTRLCDLHPVYCVPLAGGGEGVFAQAETAAARDVAAAALPGVVRGITPEGTYFIGRPDAPIRFRVFHNFGCSHCRTFHNGDLGAFIQSHVATGQAVLESVLMDFGSPPYPTEAAYAALCAGEQGAYWEMQAALYEAPAYASLDEMAGMAEDIGLDGAALRVCVESGRYAEAVAIYDELALDLGVTGTPTVFVSTGGGAWTATNRSYDNLVALTETANGQ